MRFFSLPVRNLRRSPLHLNVFHVSYQGEQTLLRVPSPFAAPHLLSLSNLPCGVSSYVSLHRLVSYISSVFNSHAGLNISRLTSPHTFPQWKSVSLQLLLVPRSFTCPLYKTFTAHKIFSSRFRSEFFCLRLPYNFRGVSRSSDAARPVEIVDT